MLPLCCSILNIFILAFENDVFILYDTTCAKLPKLLEPQYDVKLIEKAKKYQERAINTIFGDRFDRGYALLKIIISLHTPPPPPLTQGMVHKQ